MAVETTNLSDEQILNRVYDDVTNTLRVTSSGSSSSSGGDANAANQATQITAAGVTNTKLDTVNTNLGTLDGHVDGLETLATSTNTKLDTLHSDSAAVLAKIIAAPSTEAKQDTGNTSLATIATNSGTQATAANQTTGNTNTGAVSTATGTIGDTAATAGGSGSELALLRAISRDLVANIVLKAGSAIIGQMSIDQTTPGTTNNVTSVGRVAVGAAASGSPVLMAGKDTAGNVEYFFTDTTGRQIIVGAAADGAAASGNPVLIGLLDTSNNVQTIAGTTSGVQSLAGDVSGDAVNATFGGLINSGGSTRIVAIHPYLYNGTTVDRWRSDNTGEARVSLYGKVTAAGDTAILLNNSGAVGSPAIVASGTMTRTSDTNAYTAGDGVTTATSSASAMTVAGAARVAAGSGIIFGGRATKNTTGTTAASFRIWIYQGTPTAIPNDNAAFTAAVHADYAVLIGTATFDFATGIVGSDGVSVPITLDRTSIAYKLVSGTSLTIIWEARAAYSPASGEIFRLTLDTIQD